MIPLDPDDPVDAAIADALAALGFDLADAPPAPDAVVGERVPLPPAWPLLVVPPPQPHEYASFALVLERRHGPAWLMRHGRVARYAWGRRRNELFEVLRDWLYSGRRASEKPRKQA